MRMKRETGLLKIRIISLEAQIKSLKETNHD